MFKNRDFIKNLTKRFEDAIVAETDTIISGEMPVTIKDFLVTLDDVATALNSTLHKYLVMTSVYAKSEEVGQTHLDFGQAQFKVAMKNMEEYHEEAVRLIHSLNPTNPTVH